MFWILIIISCAILNRVRGGGFGGQFLPGRALFWVAPLVGLLSATVVSWKVAAVWAASFLFWGLFSWGYILARIGNYTPERKESSLEAALSRLPGTILPVFVRMLFVVPGVAAVAYLIDKPLFNLASLVFAAAVTATYVLLFRSIGKEDWQRAEIITGAIWGAMIVASSVVSQT